MISVLYVDDEKDLLMVGKIFLELTQEFTVDICSSANEALEHISSGKYDIIISDYQMPKMDGLEFLQKVRSQYGDIPFILFTGKGREEVVVKAIDYGVDYYIQKGGEPRAQFAELSHKMKKAVERKQAEITLKEKSEYLNRIFSSVKEGIVIIDAHTHEILDINPAAAAMIGTEADNIVGRLCHTYICPSETGSCPITDLHQTVDNSERILINADGIKVPIIKHVVPFTFNGRDCLLETFFNNSNRKKVQEDLNNAFESISAAEEELRQNYELLSEKEQDLRESEEKYRILVEYTFDAIFILNPYGKILFANQAAGKLIGTDNYRDVIGVKNIMDFITPECRVDVLQDFDMITRGIEGTISRYKFIAGNGQERWIESIGKSISFEGESSVHISLRDVTERQIAETQVKESEEKFRTIFEYSPYPIAINSYPDNIFLEVNPSFLAISGFSPDEILGKDPIEMGLISSSQAVKLISRRILHGKIENVPLALTAKDGRQIHVLFTTVPVTFNDMAATLTVTAEVTRLKRIEEELIKKNEELNAAYQELTSAEEELKQNYDLLLESEQALRASEEKYRLLAEVTNDIIYLIDTKGAITYVSPQISRYGYTPKDVLSQKITQFILEDDLPIAMADLEKIITTKVSIPTVVRIRDKTGNIHWVEDNAAPVLDSAGYVIGLSGILRDVTERRKVEEALKESEEKFRALVEYSLEAILMIDFTGTLLFANQATFILMDITDPDGLIGSTNVFEFVAPESCAEVIHDISQVAQGIDAYLVHYKLITKTKREIWVECIGKKIPLGDSEVMLVSMRDITERKHTDEAIRESEFKFSTIFRKSPEMLTLNAIPDGVFIDINEVFLTRTGYTREEVIGKSFQDVDIFADRNEAERMFSSIRNRQPVYGMEMKFRVKSGEIRVCLLSASFILMGGKPHILATIEDITERKNVEDAVRESEQKLSSIFMNSPVALTVVSAIDGIFVDVNKAFVRNTGFSREKVIGKRSEELGLFPDRDQYLEMVSMIRDHQDFIGKEMSTRIASGEIRICQFSSNVIMMGGKPHILSSIEDITEQRQSEAATQAMVKSMVGTTGMNALDMITETLISYMKADCVMIGEIQADNVSVRVLSMIRDRKPVKNYIYHLPKTPCENVAEKGYCEYCDNVQKLFPESKDLSELNIRGYIGTPLRNSCGFVIGILCVLFRNPIHPSAAVRETMEIIAVKAAAEIERTHIEHTLQENQRMLAEAMDLANLVHWEYDIKKDLFTFDDRFYALYGTTLEREGGAYMSSETYGREFIHPGDIDVLAEEIKKALTATDPNYLSHREHRIIRRDGEVRTISVQIAITQDANGRIIKTHGVNQDITERKRYEEAIRKANRKLNLLSSITRHDILNKISIINGVLAITEPKNTDPTQSEYLRMMKSATKEIQTQIEFTRVYQDLGSHEPLWVELENVMPRSSLTGSIAVTADVQGISIFADPMLERVFFNLLDNSERHGQHVTEIRVYAYESGTDLIVVWEDNGVGIPEKDKEEIFERGFGKNTGVGMFLVREILSLTNITIKETGILGTGARFEICVPKGAYRNQSKPGC
jgi:PAS domain S-box-containing protein